MSSSPSRPHDGDALPSVYLVARREFVVRVRSRVFRIGTILIVLFLVGFVELKTRVLTTTPSVTAVGFSGPAQALARPLTEAARGLGLGGITVQTVSSEAVGESLVRNGQLDVLVVGSPLSPQVLVKDQLDATLQAALTGLVKQEALSAQLTAHGLNPRTVAAAMAQAGIHVHSLAPPSAGATQRVVLAFIVGIVLFVSLQTYGIQVAQGVAEEKESCIVEILLATLRPGQLLLGKVVGIGLVGLLQLAIIGAVALVLIATTHVVTLPSVGAADIAGGLLWFVLGYSLYAILFAAAGSLVSRVQEVQMATLPVIMALMVGYLAGFIVVLPDPGSPASTVLSMVPFLAPVLMPERIGTGDALAWQVVLAVALTLGAIGAAIWLASRIYGNAVLQTGARVRLGEAWQGH
jgi:ABC-2 type transport system permease protein